MHDIIQHHAVSHCLLQVLKFRILTSKRALDLFSKLCYAQFANVVSVDHVDDRGCGGDWTRAGPAMGPV